jgi:regulator of cell morphogenesis and NO signaling
MGFGDKTIGEICRSHSVDTESFLTLLMFHAQPDKPDKERLCHLDAVTILTYLKNSHTYFLDYRLPASRSNWPTPCRHTCHPSTILQYFDEYETEVKSTWITRTRSFFPYVESLWLEVNRWLFGKGFSSQAQQRGRSLEELLSLLIKYLPTEGQYFLLSDALEAIKRCHAIFPPTLHTYLEDDILVPKIHLLEKHQIVVTIKTTKNPTN